MPSRFNAMLSVISCLGVGLSMAVLPVQASDKVFVIKQVQNGSGIRTVCVNEEGIKFIQEDFAVISKAPDWKVVYLNKHQKTYFQTGLDDFKGVPWLDKIPAALKAVDASEGEVKGLKVSRLESESKDEKGEKTKIEVLATSSLPLAKSEKDLIRAIYGQSNLDGLPLSIKVEDSDAQRGQDRGSTLDTDWCMEKKMPVGFFSIPKGYTEVKSQSELEKLKASGKVRVRKYQPFVHSK